jgi:putative hemolysin
LHHIKKTREKALMKSPLKNQARVETIGYTPIGHNPKEEVSDGRYIAKMVDNTKEFKSVLRLRFDVFQRELALAENSTNELDFDEYDFQCNHIIVTEKETGKTVGTYRLNTIEGAKNVSGFYAFNEFSIEDLPADLLKRSVELGRACIAKDHRNSRVLFLLWRVLANFLKENDKRYLFGCCSIFTQDGEVAAKVLDQLKTKGHLHETIEVKPREDKICIPENFIPEIEDEIDLPALVNIYLRIGAKVCGEPAIDREFKTVDYFVIFDLHEINRRYKKMFFG